MIRMYQRLLLAVMLFSGCKSTKLDGTYYGYNQHQGILFFLSLQVDHNFLLYGEIDTLKGSWVSAKDTLYLYAPSFKHMKTPLNKGFEYFLSKTKDTAEAIKLWADNMMPDPENQLTINDSMDIFLIKNEALYLINPKITGFKGVDPEIYLKKAKDTTEVNILKGKMNWKG